MLNVTALTAFEILIAELNKIEPLAASDHAIYLAGRLMQLSAEKTESEKPKSLK